MNVTTIDNTQRKAAKVAGFAFLLAMAIIVTSNFAVYEPLIVSRDAAQTAQNILSHERQFRLGIVLELIYSTTLVVLLTALYVILRPVSRGLALLGVLFRLIYAALWLLMTANLLYSLRLLHSADYLRVFEVDRVQALARFYLAMRFELYYVGLLFYTLSSLAFSHVWLKSGYIPRWLAIFGWIASAWGALCTIGFFLIPNFDKVVNLWLFDTGLGAFELILGLWLLAKGLNTRN
jgi:hypothetical protein